MPWNTGGNSGDNNGRPGDGRGSGDGDGHGDSPWGNTGGSAGGGTPPPRNGRRNSRPEPPRSPPGTPWGSGGHPANDLEQIIARLQAWLRGLLPGGSPGRRGLLLLVIVVIAIWLGTGFYRVQPDEQGVVLRFGAFTRLTAPGLNYHMPWPIEAVELPAVTRVNRIDIGYRAPSDTRQTTAASLAARDVPAESLMLTGDENIIDINFSVFWNISNAPDFLFNTRNPAYTVKSAAESVMREVIGRTPIQPALTEARASIEQQVKDGTQAILNQYGAGVVVTQVQLQRVDPPNAVIDSFRDVQRANTDAERMRNEAQSYSNDIVPRARGDAAVIVAQADADRQASIAQASGESQRFLSVLSAYDTAKDITLKRLYIETMQAILSKAQTIVLDDNTKNLVPYLPLTAGATPPPPLLRTAPTSSGNPASGSQGPTSSQVPGP